MQDVRVDENGRFHCWKCGGTNLLSKRTFRSKAMVGVGALATHKKLKCQSCGQYNQTNAAKPFDPTMVGKPFNGLEKFCTHCRKVIKKKTGVLVHVGTGVATCQASDRKPT